MRRAIDRTERQGAEDRARRGGAIAAVVASALIGGCSGSAQPPPVAKVESAPRASAVASASATAQAKPLGPTENEAALAAMLAKVSTARGLPVKSPVALRTLDRATIETMIRDKAARELPPDVLENETEAMVGLGLVAPSYDAIDGMFEMIGSSIAGFYEPDDRTMYLAADLGKAERDETLAHELVHALQDQHYQLGPMFEYRPDADELLAAGHALAEGDATSAMLDVARGSAGLVDEERFEEGARTSIQMLAPDTPAALRQSLVCPYTDGLAFVQALRRRGGFAAVDAAWRSPPTTTEQLLHVDKYDAREAAIEIASPSLEGLAKAKEDRRFTEAYTMVLGEQGLRIVLEQWSDRDEAARAAAGWGGDRVLLAKGAGKAAGELAVAWHLRFDTERDAKEMADVLSSEAHGDCVSRPDVGPFAWVRKKSDIALAMGPYSRTGKQVRPTGTCKEAKWWAQTILNAKPAATAAAAKNP